MRRVTAVAADTATPTCVNLRPSYQSMEKFLRYKDTTLNTDDIATYVGGLLASDLQNKGTPQQQAGAQQRVNENLGKLRVLEQNVANMMKCVQNDIIQKQKYSTKIYNLQSEVQDKQAEVDSMEKVAKEAQERAQLLENPYSKTTRWETWFPLGRPLQQTSLPVLLSFALLFLVLSLGMFLRLAHVDLKLGWKQNSGSGYLSTYGIGR